MNFFEAARPQRRIITICMVAASLLQTLDATIANVALPHMQGALSATNDQISWVLTSYLISAAIMTPSIGWLAGRFGRRRLFLVSMIGFTIASMACGASQTLEQMVLFRMVQGVFGASLVPLSQSVMLDIYEPHERGHAMALWSVGVMLGPIIGPTLGAWLTDSYNWRYVFYVNLPIGVLGVIGLWFFLPQAPLVRSRRFEWFGFASLSLAIAGLQLVLDRGETKDWFDSREIIVEATLAVVGLYLFAMQMWLGPERFISLQILRDRNFLNALGLQFVVGVAQNSTGVLLPPYFQTLAGYPVILSGMAMAPRGLGTVLSAPLMGFLVNRFDPRMLMLCGLGVLSYSTWAMTLWSPETSIVTMIPVLMLQGTTLSVIFTPMQTVAFATLPPHLRTECSGLLALFRNLGGSIGVAVVETLLVRNTQVAHADLARFATPFNRALQSGGAMAGMNPNTAHGAAMLDQLITYNAQVIAYRDDFLAMLFGVLPAVVMVLLMRSPRRTSLAPEESHLPVE
jgi:MFS transporter, DHA2 family, multidrug resistance protein